MSKSGPGLSGVSGKVSSLCAAFSASVWNGKYSRLTSYLSLANLSASCSLSGVKIAGFAVFFEGGPSLLSELSCFRLPLNIFGNGWTFSFECFCLKEVFIKGTKLLRVAVVLLVFVSQLGNFILVWRIFGHVYLGNWYWRYGFGTIRDFWQWRSFDLWGLPGDLSKLGLRKDSLDYCDTTVTFGGTTVCLRFFIPELGIIPGYCTICATGETTPAVELWIAKCWIASALVVIEGGGRTLGDVEGISGLPWIAGTICGFIAWNFPFAKKPGGVEPL